MTQHSNAGKVLHIMREKPCDFYSHLFIGAGWMDSRFLWRCLQLRRRNDIDVKEEKLKNNSIVVLSRSLENGSKSSR